MLETITKKIFDLVVQNAKADVSAGSSSKIACAFPQAEDPAGFGPWTDQVLRQVYYESDLVTTAPIEIDFRFGYKTSAAGQYIDAVYADPLVKVPPPYSLDARIEFRDADLKQNSDGLEMAVIPLVVTVTRSHPVFGIRNARADGELRGDGQSSLSTFQGIDA